MRIVAYIFARGGSKGLPNKNIKLFAGKPLISWSISHALSIKRIDRVVVSTDSIEIADISLKYGAEVPFIRPANLSKDESPEWLAWRHALEYEKDTLGLYPDLMLSIPTTSPLRIPLDIENCINAFDKNFTDMVISVTEARRNPYFNMVKLRENDFAELIINDNKTIFHRQDAIEAYDMTTVCYAADPIFVMKKDSIFEGRVKAVKVPPERSIDIDSQLDFDMAEFLFLNSKFNT